MIGMERSLSVIFCPLSCTLNDISLKTPGQAVLMKLLGKYSQGTCTKRALKSLLQRNQGHDYSFVFCLQLVIQFIWSIYVVVRH